MVFSFSCDRLDYQQKAKISEFPCELPQCSEEDFRIICSGYPYIENTYIKSEIYQKLDCVYCPGDWITSKKINEACLEEFTYFPNEFWIDKEKKYRLWYGKKDYQFFDIRSANCVIFEDKIECGFDDMSDILEIIPHNGYLEIIKEKSVWHLYNYIDEINMRLKLVEPQ